MAQRVRLQWPAGRQAAAPVAVSSTSVPRDGWTLADAVALLSEGYGLAATSRRTGFSPGHLRAAAADADVTDIRP